jgi:trehalose 6-phosphate synthase
VLVLSRFAGAAREMGGALIVNPFDVEAMAEALHRALAMPLDERQKRWQEMMETLRRNNIGKWREDFLRALRGDLSARAAA